MLITAIIITVVGQLLFMLSPDSSTMAALSSPFYSLPPEGRSMKQKWSMKRSKGASNAGAGTSIPIIQKLRSRRMSAQSSKAKGRKPQPLLSSTCNSSPDMTLLTVPSGIMPGGQLKISPLMPYLVKSSSSDTLNTSSTSISSLSDDSCGDFPSVVFRATLKEVQQKYNQDNMILWNDSNGHSGADTERDRVLWNDGDMDDGGFWSSTNEFRDANQDAFCWFESTPDYYNQATRKQRRRKDADRICEHSLNIIVEKLSPRTEETIVSSEDGLNSNDPVLSESSDDGSFVSAVDSDSFVSAIMIMSSNKDHETTTKSSENSTSSSICKNHIKSDLPILAFKWGVSFAAK